MLSVFRLARKGRAAAIGLLALIGLAACDLPAPSAMRGSRDAVPVALLVPASAPDGGAALAALLGPTL